jgi:hypothetical protein
MRMRFCVLTVVLMTIQVIWDVMPCLLVDMRVSEMKTLINMKKLRLLCATVAKAGY